MKAVPRHRTPKALRALQRNTNGGWEAFGVRRLAAALKLFHRLPDLLQIRNESVHLRTALLVARRAQDRRRVHGRSDEGREGRGNEGGPLCTDPEFRSDH